MGVLVDEKICECVLGYVYVYAVTSSLCWFRRRLYEDAHPAGDWFCCCVLSSGWAFFFGTCVWPTMVVSDTIFAPMGLRLL